MSENKKEKENLISSLIKGYMEMSSVNLALAEEAAASDSASLALCEQNFAEREKIDSKKRRYLLCRP